MNFSLQMFIIAFTYIYVYISSCVKFLVFLMLATRAEGVVDFGVVIVGSGDSGGMVAVTNTTVAVTDPIGQWFPNPLWLQH
jgi:hypothetical protein